MELRRKVSPKRKKIHFAYTLFMCVSAVTLLPEYQLNGQNKIEFVRGDVNADGASPNISDSISILNYLFQGSAQPPCLMAADCNNDGRLNVADGIFHLIFLFNSGRTFPDPYPFCGFNQTQDDQTLDDLTCDNFTPCDCDSRPDYQLTVSWNSSRLNEDGSLLIDLAGYKIYYGLESRKSGEDPPYPFNFDTGLSTSYTISMPSRSDFYFAVTAYDWNDNESGFSPEIFIPYCNTP